VVELGIVLSRLRQEDGFTLVELLVAMVIGLIVIFAGFNLIDSSVRVNASVAGRTDAAQRGRIGVDEITRALRSQVCANGVAPVTTATPTQVTFTADLSDGSRVADLRSLTYDPTGDKVTETVTPGSGTEPNVVFTGTPKSSVVLTDADPDPSAAGGAVFTYFAATAGSGGAQFTSLGSTVAAADLPRIARIDIGLSVRPARSATGDKRSALFDDSVIVRSVNPDSATPVATCPTAGS
jgi:prepilin-type N-terminal cleavage/methylation domain-containing protein